jgi:hypothetical protein
VRDLLGHANIFTTSLYSHIVVDDAVPPDPFGSPRHDLKTKRGGSHKQG